MAAIVDVGHAGAWHILARARQHAAYMHAFAMPAPTICRRTKKAARSSRYRPHPCLRLPVLYRLPPASAMEQLQRGCIPQMPELAMPDMTMPELPAMELPSMPALPDGNDAWKAGVESALEWYAWAADTVSNMVETPVATASSKPELVRSGVAHVRHVAAHLRAPGRCGTPRARCSAWPASSTARTRIRGARFRPRLDPWPCAGAAGTPPRPTPSCSPSAAPSATRRCKYRTSRRGLRPSRRRVLHAAYALLCRSVAHARLRCTRRR